MTFDKWLSEELKAASCHMEYRAMQNAQAFAFSAWQASAEAEREYTGSIIRKLRLIASDDSRLSDHEKLIYDQALTDLKAALFMGRIQEPGNE